MLFNTIEYVTFFLVVLAISWLIAGYRPMRTGFILLASFWFYFSNNHWQIILLLFTTTVDWAVCLRMAKETRPYRRKWLLSISLISNLGLLFYFKYFNFAFNNIVSGLAAVGWNFDWVDLNIMLPVGISFFTFEALSYTIDVYRGRIPAERHWHRLAFLVSFFPHLIAGPIVRAADFFPQMARPPELSYAKFEEALYLIFAGMLKKLILADTLAVYADSAFNNPTGTDIFTAWLGVYAFSFQIFFDFSGYTDIARGCGKLLGYELPENFRRPYMATSITDFWRRWHMSLSSWLRDYVYISFGGNRMRTQWGVYRNLMLTMLLGGFWHGAAWHFVAWGGIHGLLLSAEKMLKGGADVVPSVLRRGIVALVVFHLTTIIWIPFRAHSLEGACELMNRMVTPELSGTYTRGMLLAAGIILTSWAWQFITEYIDLPRHYISLPLPLRSCAYTMVAILVFLATSENAKSFIYFQF